MSAISAAQAGHIRIEIELLLGRIQRDTERAEEAMVRGLTAVADVHATFVERDTETVSKLRAMLEGGAS